MRYEERGNLEFRGLVPAIFSLPNLKCQLSGKSFLPLCESPSFDIPSEVLRRVQGYTLQVWIGSEEVRTGE